MKNIPKWAVMTWNSIRVMMGGDEWYENNEIGKWSFVWVNFVCLGYFRSSWILQQL